MNVELNPREMRIILDALTDQRSAFNDLVIEQPEASRDWSMSAGSGVAPSP